MHGADHYLRYFWFNRVQVQIQDLKAVTQRLQDMR